MNAQARVKSGNVNSRWSLPSRTSQPGRAPRRPRTSASVSLEGLGIERSRLAGGRHHHRGALDVLVPDLADVEGFDVLRELGERLIEARQRLALARQRRGAGEDEVLHVGVVDPALLDLRNDLGER